jgi:hypothetical protein
LSGCKKTPKYDMREEEPSSIVSKTYSPNDVSISLMVVEPNSLSEPKDYHYKLLFPPLEEPDF